MSESTTSTSPSAFYSTLFAAEPTVIKADYAKWMLDDPRVNFAISAGDHARKGIEHLGIQAESAEELSDVYGRLKAADGPVLDEGATTCCYAKSEKSWIADPDGIVWEAFSPTERQRSMATAPRSGRCPTAKAATNAACPSRWGRFNISGSLAEAWRLSGHQSAAGAGGGGVHCPGGEVVGELGVPGFGLIGHRAPRGEPLFDCPAPIISLVRFHPCPPFKTVETSAGIAKGWLISTGRLRRVLASRVHSGGDPALGQKRVSTDNAPLVDET